MKRKTGTMTTPRELLTIDQIAKFLELSPEALFRLVKRGVLRCGSRQHSKAARNSLRSATVESPGGD